jgi:DNA replication protein DnaC
LDWNPEIGTVSNIRYPQPWLRRYRHHPTILTTNLSYDEWPNFLGTRPMVEALLSRLRHYCHTVLIDGPSLRERQD